MLRSQQLVVPDLNKVFAGSFRGNLYIYPAVDIFKHEILWIAGVLTSKYLAP